MGGGAGNPWRFTPSPQPMRPLVMEIADVFCRSVLSVQEDDLAGLRAAC
jgi:hypothetical protein